MTPIAAYLSALGSGAGEVEAGRRAAEAVATDPWRAVVEAGALARSQLVVADRDLGLDVRMRVVGVDDRDVVARIGAGAPYPTWDAAGRRRGGGFDSPRDMAHRVVDLALRSTDGPRRRALDPACGNGALLLALAERGLGELVGWDFDPRVLAVAAVAVPRAVLDRRDALFCEDGGFDVVAANPPFVGTPDQPLELRARIRARWPELSGRFDLAVPFAARGTDWVREGGGVGLILPVSALSQKYGRALRRRWLSQDVVVDVTEEQPFPGASVRVSMVGVRRGGGPAHVGGGDLHARDLLAVENAPLTGASDRARWDLASRVEAASVRLGDLARVDTGVVAFPPGGGGAREHLLFDEPGDGRVPYADARDYFAGRRRWLEYRPERMHRPKRPEWFRGPKIVVQRILGGGRVKADIDRSGVFVGHTCSVVVPNPPCGVSLERLLAVIQSPVALAVRRLRSGARVDLYPRDLAEFPVPRRWCEGGGGDLPDVWGLSAVEVARLCGDDAAAPATRARR